MTEALDGVRVFCGYCVEAGRSVPCLRCGRPFNAPRVAWAVWSGTECLGVMGACCLTPMEQQRVIERTHELARGEAGDPRAVIRAIEERGGSVHAEGYVVRVTPREMLTKDEAVVLSCHRGRVLPWLWDRDGTWPSNAKAKGWRSDPTMMRPLRRMST